MLDIFTYESPQAFLHDAWEEKKKKNPAFSMRSWARRLGFKNNAALSLMLGGKRPIPKKYVPQFAADLGLNAEESLYLDALVDFHNAHTSQEKEFCLARLRAIAPQAPIVCLELEHFKFLGDPIHTCILEMMDLSTFRDDAHWLQKRLLFPADIQRIEGAIDRLHVLGLIEQKANGKWAKKQRHLTNRSDVIDKGVQEFHARVSALAAEAVVNQSVSDREFNSYAMNICKKDLPKAKKLLRDFAMEFIKEVEAPPHAANETYQLNLQLFGMARLGAG